MDTKRIVLYAALALIVYNLFLAWNQDYPPVKGSASVADFSNDNAHDNHLLPTIDTDSKIVTEERSKTIETDLAKESNKRIDIHTDVLSLSVDLTHGDIVSAKLLDYPVSLEQKNTPFDLLFEQNKQRYVANSSLVIQENGKTIPLNIQFSTKQDAFTLEKGADELSVVLHGLTDDGLKVDKILNFKRGQYLIDVQYHLKNKSDITKKLYLNTQLLRSNPDEDKSSIFHVGSFTGASYSQPGEHTFKKVSFSDMSKSNLNVNANGGWVAMQQHYFLSAWIPPQSESSRLYTRAVDDTYVIGAVSKPISLKSDEQGVLTSQLYLGPEITHVLKAIAPGLDLTIDYGWLWFLSSFIFMLMRAIYSVVGNWGWSIVLVTVLIKLAFYRLSAASYKSMAGMRQLQPKLAALKEKYGDDKAKMSQETMELYRKEKINPLGGCLPILIQIPVFIALYWVLLESVELRQAPFMLWIQDLASADPYHVLPIIMGATMLIQQKLNPTPPDPVQAKMMMMLPLLFTALFWNFPAGLVLYWIVNNTLSILQQWYITQKYSPKSANVPAANKA